ncbi:Shugoshin-1 [Platanthera guangdongensis]|uniref:Shugoshin-1 n=1 Tax=Platanthera guangdongensis TaxID=2320717 RepID=A0ABR2MSJ1_9ASPA
MEETGGALTMEGNTSLDPKGILVREWRQKTSILPRKRLSDITNLSVNEIENGLVVPDIQKNVKTGSPAMVNEYIAKILKENNVLMSVLAERNLEVQNLRLMVAKINQQNLQFAQAHSQMLAEVNLVKDRLKAAQLETKCSSAALKVKTQEWENLKKFNKKNKQNKCTTTLETAEQPVENIVDAFQLPSNKKICLPNRMRPKRSQSLGPGEVSITNQATTEEENRRRQNLRRLINLKVEPCETSGDLFEVEDAKFPICLHDERELKDEAVSRQQEPASPAIRIKVEQEDQFASSLGRTSLGGGRPLRRAAVRVNSYKEMALNTKLRR